MMRNLGSVCAKLGRSETMMMNTKESTCGLKRIINSKGRRCYSTARESFKDFESTAKESYGDFEWELWGALGTGWRTLARGSAFYFIGYKFCGEYLKPFDTQNLKKCIKEADSYAQTYQERIQMADRSIKAVLKLEEEYFGPKH